jgi:hypothetical protein
MLKRQEEKKKRRSCREQVRLWRLQVWERDAADPELARLEAAARLILSAPEDNPIVDLPFDGIATREEAERIIERATELLGPPIPAPDCYDPRKELDLLESARPRPGSRPQ